MAAQHFVAAVRHPPRELAEDLAAAVVPAWEAVPAAAAPRWEAAPVVVAAPASAAAPVEETLPGPDAGTVAAAIAIIVMRIAVGAAGASTSAHRIITALGDRPTTMTTFTTRPTMTMSPSRLTTTMTLSGALPAIARSIAGPARS